MKTGEKIKELMTAQRLNQPALAKLVGVTPQTIWKIVNDESKNSVHFHKIARVLGTTVEYLTGEVDDPSPTAIGEARLPYRAAGPATGVGTDPDLVQVQEFDIGLGMGGGGFLEGHIPGTPRTFSRAWLRQFTRAEPQHLLWTTGIGDSMTPTIADQDVILIDTSDQVPRISDKIWALALGGMGMVKRLRPTKDGEGMRIMSDNPAVPEEIAFDGEMNVIGRIVAIVRRV